MNLNHNSLRWMRAHWKLIAHLILRTGKFGLNNRWWNDFDSLWGLPTWKKALRVLVILPLIDSYQEAKFRARIGFLHPDEYKMLWGKEAGDE